ncbi:nuclear protein localization protein 4 homolog [Tubulanus polymorphus]|uniref:nuclear protein localization protein 4 homolog n=1 Tax=Tubulanus polymorphus TaxID=672921 RepID=UPI003DA2046A
MSKSIVLRVQSPAHGTKRIQSSTTEKVQDFLEKVKATFNLPGTSNCIIYKQRNNTDPIKPSRSKTITSYNLKHGDMVYLSLLDDSDMTVTDSAPSTSHSSTTSASAQDFRPANNKSTRSASIMVIEDEVDISLNQMDGKIQRERNEQLCRHGPKGKCFHCSSLEPYDEEYLKTRDPPIKFLSFHSYIRKLCGGADKGKFVSLENLSCKIKPGCKEHPPWPGGICTKCQPNAVTLKMQQYRHVDNVMFENPFIVENFLNYYRSTGSQRIGFMYGKYEYFKDVPLGIRATVAAIYEPPQVCAKNKIELLEDVREETVEKMAKALGLRRVGWIFTDLVAEDLSKGTVKCFRGNMDAHFISADECIMAADLQNKYPNPCRLSPDGHFGSKFVTVVATGDENNQIHFEGYQVTDQCMALVRDDCLVPTYDVPELGYIKESTNEQYVPDVFYTMKDEYGNEVTKLARPLPVEYLLVDLPAAFPMEQKFTFTGGIAEKHFPVGNREDIGTMQDFNAFASYMHQFAPDRFLEAVSDFNLLLYMSTCDMLPLKEHMAGLLEAVKNKDEALAHHWSKTEEWQTCVQLMDHIQAPSPPLSRGTSFTGPNASPLPPIGATGGGALWTCAHCTFLNQPNRTACEMCTLPK